MAATKEQWKAYRAELAHQLENELRFVADAEAGKTGIWAIANEGRIDSTAAHIQMSKRAAEVLEGVIAKIDKDHLVGQ